VAKNAKIALKRKSKFSTKVSLNELIRISNSSKPATLSRGYTKIIL
jgi:hypothetical protein